MYQTELETVGKSSPQSCFRSFLSLDCISVHLFLFSQTGECVKEIPQICCQCCRRHFLTVHFFSTSNAILSLLAPYTEFIVFKALFKDFFKCYSLGLLFFLFLGGAYFFLYQTLYIYPESDLVDFLPFIYFVGLFFF